MTAVDAPASWRRHSVIMFSDVEAYTKIAEANEPEDVAAALQPLKVQATAIIEGLGGVVVQFAGDGIFAAFGLQLADDYDARRCIRAALRVHKAARERSDEWVERLGHPLRMHTGIEVGIVAMGVGGDPRDGLYRLVGDSVNTASRLAAAAGTDEILIGSAVHSLAHGMFLTDSIGKIHAKNKTQPVYAHRVLAERSDPPWLDLARQRGLNPYVRREAEHAELERALAEVQGGHGRWIAVRGDPGIGKSRLIHEFAASAAERGARVVEGRCDGYGNAAPYHPFASALRNMFPLPAAAGAVDGLRAELQRQIMAFDPGLAEHLPALLQIAAPELQTDSPLDTKPDERALGAAIAALDAWVAALGRAGPAVVLIEDWHCSDEASRRAASSLRRTLGERRVLVVATSRDDVTAPRSDRERALDLTPLSVAHTGELMRSAFKADHVPSELVAFVQERTGGNPFFIEEICRALDDTGALERIGTKMVMRRSLDSMRLPDTLKAVVHATLDRLPPREARVLRLASVVGYEFDLAVVVAISPDAEEVENAREWLLGAGLLRAGATPAGITYSFKHATLADVAYETLAPRERRRLHAAIGAHIERGVTSPEDAPNEKLAHHYGLSDEHEKAARYSGLAGANAARSFSLGQALRHYEHAFHALDQLAPTADAARLRLDISLGWAPVCVFQPSRAQVAVLWKAQAAAADLGDLVGSARCHYWIGWIEYALGAQERAIDAFEEGLRLAALLGDAKLIAQLQINIGQSYAAATRYPEAVRYLREGIEGRKAAPRDSVPPRAFAIGGSLPYALGYLGFIAGERGRFAEAEEHLNEALSSARRLGQRGAEGSILTQRTMVEQWRGAWESSRDLAIEMSRVAERIGGAFILAMGRYMEALARHSLGEPSLEAMRTACDWLAAADMKLALSFNYGCLAELLAMEGHSTEATHYARRALARARGWDRLGEVSALRALAIVEGGRDRAGARDRALRSFSEALRLAHMKESPREVAVTQLRMAEMLARAHQHHRATDAALQARASFEAMGMKPFALQAEAVVTGAGASR